MKRDARRRREPAAAPLASTAPKTLGVRDVAYVEALAFRDTIVTVPEKTLLAFADQGVPRLADGDGAHHSPGPRT